MKKNGRVRRRGRVQAPKKMLILACAEQAGSLKGARHRRQAGPASLPMAIGFLRPVAATLLDLLGQKVNRQTIGQNARG